MSDHEERIKAIEEWIEEFKAGAEACAKELEEQFGGCEITFIPDPSLLRDKNKDN